MNIDELRHKALLLPLEPGCYLMKDRSGEIIYVGKAKALKNRVAKIPLIMKRRKKWSAASTISILS